MCVIIETREQGRVRAPSHLKISHIITPRPQRGGVMTSCLFCRFQNFLLTSSLSILFFLNEARVSNTAFTLGHCHYNPHQPPRVKQSSVAAAPSSASASHISILTSQIFSQPQKFNNQLIKCRIGLIRIVLLSSNILNILEIFCSQI